MTTKGDYGHSMHKGKIANIYNWERIKYDWTSTKCTNFSKGRYK